MDVNTINSEKLIEIIGFGQKNELISLEDAISIINLIKPLETIIISKPNIDLKDFNINQLNRLICIQGKKIDELIQDFDTELEQLLKEKNFWVMFKKTLIPALYISCLPVPLGFLFSFAGPASYLIIMPIILIAIPIIFLIAMPIVWFINLDQYKITEKKFVNNFIELLKKEKNILIYFKQGLSYQEDKAQNSDKINAKNKKEVLVSIDVANTSTNVTSKGLFKNQETFPTPLHRKRNESVAYLKQ